MSNKSQIVSPFVVRIVASIMALIDLAIIAVVIMNFSSLETWFAVLVLTGTIGTLYFPYKAMRTGDAEWVMLDLILPT